VKLVDLNLLLYAVNADAPHHQRARDWWEAALSGTETVALAWPVVLGFLRLATRPGLFPHPLTCEQALTLLDEWIQQPVVVLLNPGERHWSLLQALLTAAGTAGNLTTDAFLAALAVEYDAELHSADADFLRFSPPLRFVNPLAQGRPE
jgi:hypothetical protein